MSFQDLSKSTDAVIGYITYEQVDEDDKIQDEFIEKYIGYVEPKKKDIDELIKYFKDLFDLEEISFDKIPKKYHTIGYCAWNASSGAAGITTAHVDRRLVPARGASVPGQRRAARLRHARHERRRRRGARPVQAAAVLSPAGVGGGGGRKI